MTRKLFHIDPTRASVHSEIDAEMRFHLDARAEELVRLGHSPDDARRMALEEYGDTAAARAELAAIDRRRVGRIAFSETLHSWLQDIRLTLRGIRARPAFGVTILVTLALGIGANAAIFGVVDSVLLRPLPYARPDRLVHLWETYESRVGGRSEASYPDYLDFQSRATAFTGLAGYQGSSILVGGDQPAVVRGGAVTANFFDLLGVKPMLGRSFLPGEDAVGAPRVVLLTYGAWRQRFGGDPSVIGRRITLDGGPATVIGVLPAGFQFARVGTAELWVPISRPQSVRETRGSHWLNVIGRMRDGVSVGRAKSDVSRVMRDLAKQYPENVGRDGDVVALRDEFVGGVRSLLLVLYGAVVVVLLVACVNVANLLLIRGAAREREIAVRVALGAGRGRLLRQLLTESVLLSLVGGALGLLVARVGVHGLLALIPAQQMRGLPPLTSPGVDGRVVAYTMLVALIAGVGFGLVPALRLSGTSIATTMRAGSRGLVGGGNRLRDGLVIGEIALTVILLSGAMLFGRSLARLTSVDAGFEPDQAVVTTVTLPSRSANAARQAAFFDALVRRVRELPGVSTAGMTSKLPLDAGNSLGFAIAGQPAPEPGRAPDASYRSIVGDYFAAARIPMIAGRALDARDDANSPPVMVVNRALADAYFEGRDPTGQGILIGADTFRVVGVAGNVPIARLEDTRTPTLYVPFARVSQPSMSLVVRSAQGAAQLAPAIRSVVASLDASAAMSPVTAMADIVTASPSVFTRRFPLFLIGGFAVTALLLAIVGIYGVVSYSVALRTREIGIRTALGAQPSALMRLVVGHGARLALAGIVVGVAGASLAGRFAEKLLFGVTAGDPVTYVAVTVVLGAVAIGATVLPALRATRVDPALALRSD